MDEYTTPARYELKPTDNAVADVFDNAEKWPDHEALRRKVDGQWQPVTCRQFADEVEALAAGFITAGVKYGDHVALMSRTRYEWTLCDYALWAAGAVSVPIFPTSSAEQVEWVVGDSGATAVVVETEEHRALVESVRPRLPLLESVWTMDAGDLDGLVEAGLTLSPDVVQQRRTEAGPEDLATIIYTSGTTGRPKGCVLTHGNLVFNVRNTLLGEGVPERLFNEDNSVLLFLPLAHSFARMIQLGSVHSRACLGHTPDMKDVAPALQEFQPTAVLGVPRIFEKVYNTAQHTAAASGKARIFAVAEKVAIAYSRSLDTGGPGPWLRVEHAVFDRLVYTKIRHSMGGHVRYAVSAAAPLGERLGHFFRGVGLNILEGYGLTETSPGSTFNLPDNQKVGSVGQPLPGVTIRIAPDGEVLIRGQHIFQGYWHNEVATKEAIDEDGWFHSGDIGRLDDEGFLYITDRKKDLIVTAGGKNVAPAVLEDRLRAHWLVSQCMVVGDRRPYVAALLTLDPEAFVTWKKEHGHPEASTVDDLRAHPDLVGELQTAVDAANTAVSQAEAIKRWLVLGSDFTESGGQLTPTLKLRRNVVLDQCRDEVDRLYA